MTDLFLGDDAYHGGAFMLSANFGFYVFFRPQTEPAPPTPSVPFDFGTPDSYKFYLKAGTSRISTSTTSRDPTGSSTTR